MTPSLIFYVCQQQVSGGHTFQSRGNLGRRGGRFGRGGARAHPREPWRAPEANLIRKLSINKYLNLTQLNLFILHYTHK